MKLQNNNAKETAKIECLRLRQRAVYRFRGVLLALDLSLQRSSEGLRFIALKECRRLYDLSSQRSAAGCANAKADVKEV